MRAASISRTVILAMLLVVGVEGLDLFVKAAPIPRPASRFLHYFEALEGNGHLGGVERALYSWLLARGR